MNIKPIDLVGMRAILFTGPQVELTAAELSITPYKSTPVTLTRGEVEAMYAGLWEIFEHAIANGEDFQHRDYAETSGALLNGAVLHILEPGFVLDEPNLYMRGMEGLKHYEDRNTYKIWGDLYEVTELVCGREIGGVPRLDSMEVMPGWLEKYYPGASNYMKYLLDMGVTDNVELGKSVYSVITSNVQVATPVSNRLPVDLIC